MWKHGRKKNIHPAHHCICPLQITLDVEWLHGALTGALSFQSKTSSLIMRLHTHRDGIKLWWELLNTHRFNGDIDVHLDQQQAVLSEHCHVGYPGGPIAFLENHDTAFTNLECVGHLTGAHGITDPNKLQKHPDSVKRCMFTNKFHVQDVTSDLTDQVTSSTDTWQDMFDELRIRLVRKESHAKESAATRNTRNVVMDSNVNNAELDFDTLYTDPEFRVYLSNSHIFFTQQQDDWQVGWNLWKALADNVKQQIMERRKMARDGEDSGGRWTPRGGILNSKFQQLLPS